MKRVFLLADSISIAYGPYLREALAGNALLERKGGVDEALRHILDDDDYNGGDSANCRSYVESRFYSDFPYDLLLFNCGLHDIRCHSRDGAWQVGLTEYEQNLDAICRHMMQFSAKLLFVTTTPVDEVLHNHRGAGSSLRFENDVVRCNGVARAVAERFGVTVADLHTFTETLGGSERYADHVHFVPAVCRAQACFLADQIRLIL